MADIQQWMSVHTQSAPDSGSTHTPSEVSRGSSKYVPPALRGGVKVAEANLAIAIANRDLEDIQLKSKSMGVKKASIELPFFLKKAQLEYIQENFPRTIFKCGKDVAHDHPIAHTENMIATKNLERKMPAGSNIIDVFGSPSRAAAFNGKQARANNPKRMLPYTVKMSPKDYLRALDYPPVYAAGSDVPTRLEGHGDVSAELGVGYAGHWSANKVALLNTYTRPVYQCIQTLYYLSDQQIVDLLSHEGSRIEAVIHRHRGDSGSLFGGECTYAKKGEGSHKVVEQVNKVTGERYTHRDLSYLWESTTKVQLVGDKAYTWTFSMVSHETWIVTMTSCPPELDERFISRSKAVGDKEAAHELNEHAVVPTNFVHPMIAAIPTATAIMVAGVVIVKLGIESKPLSIHNWELVEFLSHSMVGKPRSSAQYQHLMTYARGHINVSSKFPGKVGFMIPAANVADCVTLAFISGAENEVELMRGMEAYRVVFREHNALATGAALIGGSGRSESAAHTLLATAKRINAGRKAGDTFDQILHTFDS